MSGNQRPRGISTTTPPPVGGIKAWLAYQAHLSHAGVVVVTLCAAIWISGLREEPLRVAGWVLDAAAFVALFRVNWRWYWASLPIRIADTIRGLKALGVRTVLITCGTVVIFYVIKELIPTHGFLEAVFLIILLALGLTGAMYAMTYGGVAVFMSLWTLIVGSGDDKPDGRHLVANQTVHGNADYASAARVDAALRGKGSDPAPPRRFED